MKYAPIIAVDEEAGCWRTIGVIVAGQNEVRVKVAMNDKLVRRVPAYQMIERYNDDFADGEVTFYRRDDNEMASHVEHLRTDDPNFIEKYRAELEKDQKWIRILEVSEYDGNDIDRVIDELLDKVRRVPLSAY